MIYEIITTTYVRVNVMGPQITQVLPKKTVLSLKGSHLMDREDFSPSSLRHRIREENGVKGARKVAGLSSPIAWHTFQYPTNM